MNFYWECTEILSIISVRIPIMEDLWFPGYMVLYSVFVCAPIHFDLLESDISENKLHTEGVLGCQSMGS